jgi:K+-transporting ATPase KdpF subunit
MALHEECCGNRDCGTHRAAHRHNLSPIPGGCRFAGEIMSAMNWIGLVLSLAIGIYLVIALLLPEKFE